MSSEDDTSQHPPPTPWRLIAALAALPCAIALFGHFPVYLNNPSGTLDALGIFLVTAGILGSLTGLPLSWAHRRENRSLAHKFTALSLLAITAGILLLCRAMIA